MRKAILQSGAKPPASVVVPMLVDTGASHTFVDVRVLSGRLGLSPRARYPFHSATTSHDKPEECDAYDVSISLGSLAGQNLWRLEAIEAMASEERRTHGLLGRDILNQLQLEWHGPQRQLVLLYT